MGADLDGWRGPADAIAVSPEAEDARGELAAIRRAIVAAMEAGVMPAGTDPAALAAPVTAVVQGLSALARDGATRAELRRLGHRPTFKSLGLSRVRG